MEKTFTKEIECSCQHIFKLNPYAREKKCLKCGFITRDNAIVRVYKKHITTNNKISIW